jgi:hypothetical protein
MVNICPAGSFGFAQDFGSGLRRPLNASTWAQGVTGSNPVAPANDSAFSTQLLAPALILLTASTPDLPFANISKIT